MLTLNTDQLSTQEIQQYLQYAIAPRPICFASTIDLEGNVNLSPFSFFNLFSSNPPIVIFSPARRVRGNTTKHTLQNVEKIKEVVINVVNFDIVQQMTCEECIDFGWFAESDSLCRCAFAVLVGPLCVFFEP